MFDFVIHSFKVNGLGQTTPGDNFKTVDNKISGGCRVRGRHVVALFKGSGTPSPILTQCKFTT